MGEESYSKGLSRFSIALERARIGPWGLEEVLDEGRVDMQLAEVPQRWREICFSWSFLGGSRRIFRQPGELGGVW